jgi:hypothetical protein
MGRINTARWILCGVIAGIVGDLVEILINGILLGPNWESAMRLLNRPPFNGAQIIDFNVLGLVIGLTAVWIYAGIRPRFGAGPKAAIYAGLAAWILASLLPNTFFMVIPHLFSRHLALFATLGDFLAWVPGTLVGAALYKEA